MCVSGNRRHRFSVKRSTRGLFHLFSALLLSSVCIPLGAAQLQEHRVEDLDYGRALFQYFQNDNLAAITQLMIAEHRARKSERQDEAKLLLADLYYDYGLYDESREIFSQLLTAEVSDSIQSRIWFNLARLRYEQGHFDHSRDLLSRISDRLPAGIEAETLDRIRLEVEGLSQYPAYLALRDLLLGAVGVSSVSPVEMERGRTLLEVESTADSIELLQSIGYIQ